MRSRKDCLRASFSGQDHNRIQEAHPFTIPMSLHLQSSPHFELLRNYLRAAGYNEESLCDRLEIRDMCELASHTGRPATPAMGSDELGLLIRLLLLGDDIDRQQLESALSPRVVEAFTSLGLTSLDPATEGRLFCPVAVYPIGPLFIVSDRWFPVVGKEFQWSDDFVYPAITPNTREFLAALPVTPCDSFLELCAGTGAAAMAASGYAQKSWAIDITERSTQMAEFNRLLNGLDNVTVLKGDLYEGVEGMQFDRIVAHPPYMPSLRATRVFADGGADGEQITRGTVAALPRFLKPGGTFYCLAQASDRQGAPLQQRLRGWLGEDQGDFDVAFIEMCQQDPKDAAFVYALKTGGGFAVVDLMRDSFASLGVESLPYGWIVIQRRNSPRSVFTTRRSAGQRIGREEIAWLLKWETFAAGPSALEDLQEKAPVVRPALEFHALHRMREGKLAPEQFSLHTEAPFFGDCKVQFWVGFLLPLCDGKSTVRQLWEACKTNNLIHAATPLHEFARLIGVLISGGFLEVAAFYPPLPPQKPEGQRRISASLEIGHPAGAGR